MSLIPEEKFVDWRIVHKDLVSQFPLGEVIPLNPEWATYHDRPGYCNYTIAQDHPMAQPDRVYPRRTSWELWRNDKLISAGIHTGISTSLTSETIEVSGQTWEHYLENRFWPFNPDDVTDFEFLRIDTDVFTIIEDMLDILLAQPGSLTFTYDLGNMGVVTDFKIELADREDMLSKIKSLADRAPGFDVHIHPDKLIELHSPRMGKTSGYVLEQFRNILDVEYENRGIQGTDLLATGESVSSKVGANFGNDAARGQSGRWDTSIDYGKVTSKEALLARGGRDIYQVSTPIIPITVKIKPEHFIEIYDEIEVGDTVAIKADLGYDYIDDSYRCIGIQGNLENETGEEILTLTFDDNSLEI